MTTFFKADSIRVKNNGYAGNAGAMFGKFSAIVREETIRVIEMDDSKEFDERFGCIIAWGSHIWGYATEAEAFAAGVNAMNNVGWTTDKQTAIEEAVQLAKARHEEKAKESKSYAQRYGA
jgi:hypothetical protein